MKAEDAFCGPLRHGDRAAGLVLPVDFGNDGRVHACRSAGLEHSGAFIERGAGRLDVIDDQHVGSIQRDALAQHKRAMHVFLACRVAQPGLPASRTNAAQQGGDREVEALGDGGAEHVGRMLGASEARPPVRRHGGDDFDVEAPRCGLDAFGQPPDEQGREFLACVVLEQPHQPTERSAIGSDPNRSA